jgi:outer membrane receptor protein involved in Fe transport
MNAPVHFDPTSDAMSIPLDQIDRIEILRGPASSLYGADAIGGVVQVFTRRGTGALSGNASAGYGTYGTWDVKGGVSGAARAGPAARAPRPRALARSRVDIEGRAGSGRRCGAAVPRSATDVAARGAAAVRIARR